MQRKEHKQTVATFPSLAGAATAGALEISLFHPFDTMAKRLQKNKLNLTANRSAIIFPNCGVDASAWAKLGSLYQGIFSASVYKIAQRTLKFGGQPIIHAQLDQHLDQRAKNFFGDVGQRALAGSIAGVSELIILPIDAIKIRRQTGVYTGTGVKNLVNYLAAENFKLWNGAMATVARNAPGSFILFGTEAACLQHLFGVKKKKDATLAQNCVSAAAAAVASVALTLPQDVVKTRIQAAEKTGETKAVKIIKDMVKTEGLGSFFKGVVPKVGAAAPKLMFSLLAAPVIANKITASLKPQ